MMKKIVFATLLTVALCTGCGNNKSNTGITAVEDSIVQPTISAEIIGDQPNANNDITLSNVDQEESSSVEETAKTEAKTAPHPKPDPVDPEIAKPTPLPPVPPENPDPESFSDPDNIHTSIPIIMAYDGGWLDQYGRRMARSVR